MKKILAGILSTLLLATSVSSVLAAEYFPSVEQKKAPELAEKTVEIQTESGTVSKSGVAIVETSDGKPVEVLAMSEIVITPAADVNKTQNEDAKEILKIADTELKSGEAFKDVSVALAQRAKDISPLATVDSFVVRDLIDIQLPGSDILQDDGTLSLDGKPVTLTLDFKLNLAPEEPTPTVIFLCDGLDKWEIVPEKNVQRNADGSVSVTFERMCAVALLTVTNDSIISNPGVDSPQTGVDELAILKTVTVSLCVLGAAVASVIVLRKKHA